MTNHKPANFTLSTIFFVVSLAAQRGLPFLALPIVARATSQFEYGAATLAISVSSVVSVVMTLGINAAMPRLHTELSPQSKASVWCALTVVQVAFAAALLFVGGCAVLVMGPSFMGSDAQRFAVPALLLALVTSLQMTYQGIAIARGASTRLLLATLVQLTVGLVLAQILSTAFGGRGYIYALLIASALATVLLASFRHPKPDWKYVGIRSGLKLSLPFIGQGLSTWLLALFDRIAIGVLLGATQVGGYQVAYMAGSVLGMILEGLQAAWAPRYHKSSSENKKDLLVKLLAPSLLIAGGMTVLLVAAAPLLLPVIAPDYEISYLLLWLVALSSLPRSIYFVCVAALLNEGRSTAVMTSTLVSALFTVPAVLFTIPSMGIIGGGIVTLAAFSIQALIVFHRAFNWTIPRTFALVIGPLVVAIPLTGTVLLLAQMVPAMNVIVPLLLIAPVAFLGWKCLKTFGTVLSGWQKRTAGFTSELPVPEA